MCSADSCKYHADAGVDAGGKAEALEAYEEAYNAIFALQLECHRHTQPHAKHDGTLRWEMIEMWPMPVCTSLLHSITVLLRQSLLPYSCAMVMYWWQACATPETLSSLGQVLCCCACQTARCFRLVRCLRCLPSLAWLCMQHRKTLQSHYILAAQPGGQPGSSCKPGWASSSCTSYASPVSPWDAGK